LVRVHPLLKLVGQPRRAAPSELQHRPLAGTGARYSRGVGHQDRLPRPPTTAPGGTPGQRADCSACFGSGYRQRSTDAGRAGFGAMSFGRLPTPCSLAAITSFHCDLSCVKSNAFMVSNSNDETNQRNDS